VLLLAVLLHVARGLLGAEIEPQASTADPPMGRLVLEGEGIERLVLEKPSDPRNPIHLRQPASEVVIAPGEYRVREVHLKGGYHCYPPASVSEHGTVREVSRFTIDADTPCVLRIGAPLKPTLKVVRENRTLRMAYSLLDASEKWYWIYTPEDFGREKIADFSVCRDGQTVASGALDPGG
jgi:hypothetical protein